MKSEKVLLSQLKVNEANPRRITDKKMRLLVERLLVFPKMISIRPVVVDATMTALGGNMRLRAFDIISRMDINEIVQTVSRTKNYRRMDRGQQEELLRQWSVWLDNPTVEIVRASELTDAEKKEFIIADNASFGEWDFDRLGNEWDAEELNSWGLDVWNPDSGFEPAPRQASSPAQPSIDGIPDGTDGNVGAGDGGSADVTDGSDPVVSQRSFSYQEQYGVIVICSDAGEQERVYNRLTSDGYSCKVVSV